MNILLIDCRSGSGFDRVTYTDGTTLGQLFADRYPDADPRGYTIAVTRGGKTVGTAPDETPRTWDPNLALQDEDQVSIRPVPHKGERERPLLATFEWLLRQVGFEEGRRGAGGHALWTPGSGGRTLIVKRLDREYVSAESVEGLADALGLSTDELARTLFGREIARRKALRDLRDQGKLAARPGLNS